MTENRPTYEPMPERRRHTITAHVDLDSLTVDFEVSGHTEYRDLAGSAPLIVYRLAALIGQGVAPASEMLPGLTGTAQKLANVMEMKEEK